jgi:nickel-dependent lactate racemase
LKLNIPYARGYESIKIDNRRVKAVLEAHPGKPSGKSQKDIVADALQNPIGSQKLSQLALGKEKILIITSDHTRPVPSKITLPLIIKEIESQNPKAQIKVLIATGAHRESTPAEMADKYGEDVIANYEFINHISTDSDSMVFKGTLPSGGELWVNNLVDWAELIISEGFIEPHFFAGFSGGRKSVLPGICSKKTIMYNHNAHFVGHENARTGVLDGNPIHRDMIFAAKTVGLGFILNVVLNGDKEIIAAFAGDYLKAHEAGCEYTAGITGVKKESADIVVVSNGGYPLDQNIYQTVKGMTAAESCINENGVMIVISSCADGHGGESFFNWFNDHASAQEIVDIIEGTPPEETIADQWEAQIFARVLKKCKKVILVSHDIDKTTVNSMHMEHAETFGEALKAADEILGYESDIVIIPDGVGVIMR